MSIAVGRGAFGIYVHVPFCATRCGYCDFNTYTPSELGGANLRGWLEALKQELALAAPLPGIGMLHGKIDRLVITEDRVLAVDYKSNRDVPATP